MDLRQIEGAVFVLNRVGKVKLRSWCWVDTLNAAEPLTLHYKVKICVSKLDSYNYIYDNMEVEKYFNETFEGKTLEASCELIALTSMIYFCCHVENCTEVMVDISGEPSLTWLTAHAPDVETINYIKQTMAAEAQ